jgi:hypothetical protein
MLEEDQEVIGHELAIAQTIWIGSVKTGRDPPKLNVKVGGDKILN